ncbi:hypothetical protein DCE93_14245 [Agromyces badenianii]|uniref:Uncharacterized protein n=2 Tax=Agromyces badenianii TaxID=2080742 RepID=A0A2S0WZ78_9MICO|nr:hypothetical protein DCE93_14245 [Agromyces badenianii]
MTNTLDHLPEADSSSLPGASILARVRGLIWSALGYALAYGFITNASRSACPGGYGSDGGYVDADGQPTVLAPQCISLTLQPSVFVAAAIVIVVLAAITRVLKRAGTEADAFRIIDRAGIVIIAVVTGSILISHVWFWLIPIADWNGSGTLWFPFPFGSVTMDTYPAAQG